MRSLKLLAVAATLLFTGVQTSAAGTLYRYQDKAGNPVISHILPQEASQRGYDVLNSSGRVVETVAPALTEAELAQKRAQEEELARQAQAEKQRQQADRQLVRSYSHPDDIIRALHRKLAQMRNIVRLKESSIASIKSQIRDEQSRAANIERSGREIPEEIPRRIKGLEAEIAEAQADIQRQESDIALLVSDYKAKVTRLEALTETTHTLAIDTTPDDTPGSE